MRTSIPSPVVLAFTHFLDDLFEVIMARYGKFPIGGTVAMYVWKKFEAAKRRFRCLVARVAAGRIPRPRPPRAAGARGPRKTPHDGRPPITRLVTLNFGWLARVVPGAADRARALETLLSADAEMGALLAATVSTARILRPVCWMLGVSLPPPVAPTSGPDVAAAVAGAAAPGPIAIAPRSDRVIAPPTMTHEPGQAPAMIAIRAPQAAERRG